MCGERSQCLGRIGFAPTHGVCVLSWLTLLRLQVALQNCLKWALDCVHFPGLSRSGSGFPVLHWGADSVGPAFHTLPRSEQLRWPGAWWAFSPSLVVHLVTSQLQPLGFLSVPRECRSQACRVSPLGGWSLTVTLLADVNRPGSQEDLVSNWEPACSLFKDAVSGADIAPHLLALAATRLPLWLQWGEGLIRSRLTLLWCSPVFCEWARLL